MSDFVETPLPEDWDALCRADALVLAAPEGAKERVRLRLAASLGLAAGLGAAAGAVATAGGSAASSLPAEGVLGAIAKAAFLKQALVLGAVAVTAVTGGTAVYVQVRAHRASAVPKALPAKALRPPVVPAPLPVAGAAAPEATEAAPPADTLGDERALLDAARVALARKHTGEAEALLEQHASLFPSGRLREEREALSIRLLVLQGRLSEARLRAKRFKQEHPGSIQQLGIDQALRSGRH